MTPLLIVGLVSALLPVLEGADTPQRDAAIDTLGTADVSFHELSEGLGTARWRGRSGILKAVEARGEGAVDFLCRAARDRDHRDVRRLAILALGPVGRRLLRHPHGRHRVAARADGGTRPPRRGGVLGVSSFVKQVSGMLEEWKVGRMDGWMIG